MLHSAQAGAPHGLRHCHTHSLTQRVHSRTHTHTQHTPSLAMIFTAAFVTLALLSGANATDRIRWRNAGPGDSRRWVVTCNGSPYEGRRIGTTFALAHDYAKYCSMDWTVSKDKIGQLYTGGGPEPWSGKKLCMDATSSESALPRSFMGDQLTPDPGNGALPHIWDCYDGLDVQQWVYHSDGHIELGCTGYCLDVKDGYNGDDAFRHSVIQLWDCIPGSTNQLFDLVPDSSYQPGQ